MSDVSPLMKNSYIEFYIYLRQVLKKEIVKCHQCMYLPLHCRIESANNDDKELKPGS